MYLHHAGVRDERWQVLVRAGGTTEAHVVARAHVPFALDLSKGDGARGRAVTARDGWLGARAAPG